MSLLIGQNSEMAANEMWTEVPVKIKSPSKTPNDKHNTVVIITPAVEIVIIIIIHQIPMLKP